MIKKHQHREIGTKLPSGSKHSPMKTSQVKAQVEEQFPLMLAIKPVPVVVEVSGKKTISERGILSRLTQAGLRQETLFYPRLVAFAKQLVLDINQGAYSQYLFTHGTPLSFLRSVAVVDDESFYKSVGHGEGRAWR